MFHHHTLLLFSMFQMFFIRCLLLFFLDWKPSLELTWSSRQFAVPVGPQVHLHKAPPFLWNNGKCGRNRRESAIDSVALQPSCAQTVDHHCCHWALTIFGTHCIIFIYFFYLMLTFYKLQNSTNHLLFQDRDRGRESIPDLTSQNTLHACL